MKKIALIYGEKCGVQKKAIEVLSRFLLDYTCEYPACFKFEQKADYSEYRCIYLGTKGSNPYIAQNSNAQLSREQEYSICVKNDSVIIEGFDDAGVLYGCVDFYNKYIVRFEFTHNDYYHVNIFEKELPDFECISAPSIKDRGIWTWGHVIYDYKDFIDNMVLLKMNTVIIWNDFAPVNASEMVEYAHRCGVKLFWGFAWGWDTNCSEFSFENLSQTSKAIFEKYEREYKGIEADGIYFQSFTELSKEKIGDVLVAQAVTDFVNATAELFYEKYPDIELQFGLHATSVKNRLEYIKNVNPKIRIVWEDCGAFPFSYQPNDIKTFDETMLLARKIALLRGEQDRFGTVTKGLTKLDWSKFEHLGGAVSLGEASKSFKANRVVRKSKIWRFLQAYWLKNGDKALEAIKIISDIKQNDALITALVEDGMFEENIMFPVALYSEMLWDATADIKELITTTALREYITFA